MFRKMGSQPFNTVCRVCLATDVKMYLMQDHKAYYEQVTGLSVSAENCLPQALCWECSCRLLKCYRFRAQARLAHSLLESLLQGEGTVTKDNINKINRCKNGLESSLTHCLNAPNYFEVTENHQNQDGDRLQADPQIKNELDVTEKDDLDIRDDVDDDAWDSDDDKVDEINKGEPAKAATEKVVSALDETLFKITDLTFEEQIQDIEKRKETDNYKKSEFKCDKCYKGFLYETAFKFHMTRHTTKSGKYPCAVCRLHFKTRGAARHHATSHCQKFACTRCPYVTGRLHTAKLHEAFHNGTRYTCSHCDEVFRKQTTYMSHLRVKHPSDIVCELCGNSFVSQKGLYLHKRLKHRFDDAETPLERHRCEQCDLSFVKKEALQTHLRAKHYIGVREDGVIARRQKGSDPDVARRNKILSRRYVKRRAPKEPVQCEQCDATLPDSLAYARHFRRAHRDKNRTHWPSLRRNHPCMCEVCGRIFKCRSLLEDHSDSHAAAAQYQCSLCNKAFLTRYRLTVHRRIHSAQRTVFSCSVCQKTLSTRSNLLRHEFSHTGQKPHACSLCGKSFTYADQLRAHVQYVHLKKPYPKCARARRARPQDAPKSSAASDGPD